MYQKKKKTVLVILFNPFYGTHLFLTLCFIHTNYNILIMMRRKFNVINIIFMCIAIILPSQSLICIIIKFVRF